MIAPISSTATIASVAATATIANCNFSNDHRPYLIATTASIIDRIDCKHIF